MFRFFYRIFTTLLPAPIAILMVRVSTLLSLSLFSASLNSCSLWNSGSGTDESAQSILNVSYDPTREFYQEFNQLFAAHWKKTTGKKIHIRMSHGGAGKQARAVMDGLEADVVTLALEYDINAIAQKGLLNKKWRGRLPHRNAPYTSTIVFLVRKGNPRHIREWNDLVQTGIEVITPNPKTSGGARWNYLAAWAYAKANWKTDEHARNFMKMLYQNVPILDSGARGSTNTFVERGIGDVLLAWENEALMALSQSDSPQYEIVYPSMSIVAEPPVALMDANCKKHRTCKASKAYLQFLYTDEAQQLAGKYHFRPSDENAFTKYESKFKDIEMTTVDLVAKGWNAAQARHFADNGEFDRIYIGAAQ